MRYYTFYCLMFLSISIQAKEWKNLKAFQKETHKEKLSPSDWLRSDRCRNSLVWQNANRYNLNHNFYGEYVNLKQRRDFYEWMITELKRQGHEVAWVHMAYFISKKLHLLEVFPFQIFSNKKIMVYADDGSAEVFNHAYPILHDIYNSKQILTGDLAMQWDETMTYNEQYLWLNEVYKTIDEKNLKTIEHMAKGKGIYGLFVCKDIRFEGDISLPQNRYAYAVNTLRGYCINNYK